MRANDITEEKLVKDGWIYSHTAMCRGYHHAGEIDSMKDKDGFHFCRVYTSTCKGRAKYQMSYVYKKAIG